MYSLNYACPVCNQTWEVPLDEKQTSNPYGVPSSCPSCALQKIEPDKVMQRVLLPKPDGPVSQKLLPAEKEQLRTPLTFLQQTALRNMVRVLNSALAADRIAISKLFGVTMPCNVQLVNHHSVQVASTTPASVSVIGLVNALADSVLGVTAAERYARACEKAEALGFTADNLQSELYTMSSGYICATWNDETQLIQVFQLFDPVRSQALPDGTDIEAAVDKTKSEEFELRSYRSTSLDPATIPLAGGLDSNAVGNAVGRPATDG